MDIFTTSRCKSYSMTLCSFLTTSILVVTLNCNVINCEQQQNSVIHLPVGVSSDCSSNSIQTVRRSVVRILDRKYPFIRPTTPPPSSPPPSSLPPTPPPTLSPPQPTPPPPRPCSCGGAGWRRVAYLNMSDPRQTCPSNWTLNTSPVRGCGRTSTGRQTCDSVFYPVNGLSYSRVCGMATAYHKGWSSGFEIVRSINDAVSGLSVTHGPPGARQHIWTFVTAENDAQVNTDNCPCTNTSITWPHSVPSFLGNDYFCDTGRHETGYDRLAFYSNDPLWDGKGCAPTSSCCTFNSPPWFCRTLPQATTDELEIRLCNHFKSIHADKIFTLINIYVR